MINPRQIITYPFFDLYYRFNMEYNHLHGGPVCISHQISIRILSLCSSSIVHIICRIRSVIECNALTYVKVERAIIISRRITIVHVNLGQGIITGIGHGNIPVGCLILINFNLIIPGAIIIRNPFLYENIWVNHIDRGPVSIVHHITVRIKTLQICCIVYVNRSRCLVPEGHQFTNCKIKRTIRHSIGVIHVHFGQWIITSVLDHKVPVDRLTRIYDYMVVPGAVDFCNPLLNVYIGIDDINGRPIGIIHTIPFGILTFDICSIVHINRSRRLIPEGHQFTNCKIKRTISHTIGIIHVHFG